MGRLADQAIVVSERLGKRLNRRDFHVIPSGLDLELFRPMPMRESRERLNLPLNKRLVLFAASRKANPRKRYELAEQAVNILRSSHDVELVVPKPVTYAVTKALAVRSWDVAADAPGATVASVTAREISSTQLGITVQYAPPLGAITLTRTTKAVVSPATHVAKISSRLPLRQIARPP